MTLAITPSKLILCPICLSVDDIADRLTRNEDGEAPCPANQDKWFATCIDLGAKGSTPFSVHHFSHAAQCEE